MTSSRSIALLLLLLAPVTVRGGQQPGPGNGPSASRVVTSSIPGSWQSGTFAYDGAGNVIEVGDDVYRYDPLRRLAFAQVSSGGAVTTDAYQYDAFGNLHLRTTTGAAGTSQLPVPVQWSTNRLAQATYDGGGNVKVSGGAASHSYEWDPMRMLVARDGGQEIYVYTPSDERIAVRSGTQWTWSFRDPEGRLLRQVDSTEGGAWTWREDFVHRNGQVIGSERPNGRRHFHNDHLGSARLITAHDGQAVSRHDFLPFGIELTSIRQEQDRGQGHENAFRFAGHERDFTGGTVTENTDTTDYMHARYYRSMTGRFLSPDSARDHHLSLAQSWNRYAYARNNPITYVDPDGRYVAVGSGLRAEVAKAYANSATFRRVYDAVHNDPSILQKMTLGNVKHSGNQGETKLESRRALLVDNKVQFDANGKVLTGMILSTVIPSAKGKIIGHELQHGGEYQQYGHPKDAPDASRNMGGSGVETKTSEDVELAIRNELLKSRGQNTLTPEQEAAIFSVPADCTEDATKCPNLAPRYPVAGKGN